MTPRGADPGPRSQASPPGVSCSSAGAQSPESPPSGSVPLSSPHPEDLLPLLGKSLSATRCHQILPSLVLLLSLWPLEPPAGEPAAGVSLPPRPRDPVLSPLGEGLAVKELDSMQEGCPPHRPSPHPTHCMPLFTRQLPSPGLLSPATRDLPCTAPEGATNHPAHPAGLPHQGRPGKETETNLHGEHQQLKKKKNRTRSILCITRALSVTSWFQLNSRNWVQTGSCYNTRPLALGHL